MHQPFAWLVATGRRSIDPRLWSTDYRGKVAIHASASVDRDEVAAYRRVGVEIPENLVTRSFVGVVDLVDCRVSMDTLDDARGASSRDLSDDAVRQLFERDVSWTGLPHVGTYALVFANAQLVAPVPARGDKLLWTPSESQIIDLRAAWARLRKSGS